MPRPAGRSGWVSTSGTSWPAWCTAASAAAANSGVPANATLMRPAAFAAASGRRPLVFARLLQHLAADAIALEGAEVLHEHLALKVIHLVLHAHGGQPLGLEFEGPAVAA